MSNLKLKTMAKRSILVIMTVLMCWCGTLASEKEQVTNLFDGDSFAVLSEEQNKILDSVIGLIIANDSIVFLPQEISEMIGDTAKVCYTSYPDWQSAYFKKHREKDNCLFVPAYAETPYGIISSELYIEPKNENEIDCTVETFLPIEDKGGMNMMYIASNIQGEFLRCKAYTKKDMRAHKLGIYQRYFENERKESLGSPSSNSGTIYHIKNSEYLTKSDSHNRNVRELIHGKLGTKW